MATDMIQRVFVWNIFTRCWPRAGWNSRRLLLLGGLRKATDEYRAVHGLTVPIIQGDVDSERWRKE